MVSMARRRPNGLCSLQSHYSTRRRVREKHEASESSTKLGCLPNEILVHILRGLHIKDLLSLKPVDSRLCALIELHESLWTDAKFTHVWPSKHNIQYFNRAALCGNIQALIKLGVAYLYNEGLPGDIEGKNITLNGKRAAQMFAQAERLLSGGLPFTFLFIRPPWSPASRGVCCKEYVFKNMITYNAKHPVAAIHQSVAQTMSLLGKDAKVVREMMSHLEAAARLGSVHAKYMMWSYKYRDMPYPSLRQKISDLASIDRSGLSISGRLELCRAYASHHHGNLSESEAASYVRAFIDKSQPTLVNTMFRFQELTHSMRYILMDWLVEVANMKDYNSLTLHLAIHAVDRFLMRQRVTRAQLQLLGVSAMVLCSRFMGNEIITIREAAWLTDNTYKYEDVVRMMGEITATLRGNFRVLTTLDYTRIVSLCGQEENKPDPECALMAEYVCELCLLQSETGDTQQGVVGCVCVLLARAVLGRGEAWTKRLEQFTGYSLEALRGAVMDVYAKCFSEERMLDHRSVELEAVRHRYAEVEYLHVSKTQMLPEVELRRILGVRDSPTEQSVTAPVTPTSRPQVPEIITSPSRKTKGSPHKISMPPSPACHHETPVLEKRPTPGAMDGSPQEGATCVIDEDSDIDLETLWCADSMGDNSRSHTPSLARMGDNSRNTLPGEVEENSKDSGAKEYQGNTADSDIKSDANDEALSSIGCDSRSQTESLNKQVNAVKIPSNVEALHKETGDKRRSCDPCEKTSAPCDSKMVAMSRCHIKVNNKNKNGGLERSETPSLGDSAGCEGESHGLSRKRTVSALFSEEQGQETDNDLGEISGENSSFSSFSSGVIKCEEDMGRFSSPNTNIKSSPAASLSSDTCRNKSPGLKSAQNSERTIISNASTFSEVNDDVSSHSESSLAVTNSNRNIPSQTEDFARNSPSSATNCKRCSPQVSPTVSAERGSNSAFTSPTVPAPGHVTPQCGTSWAINSSPIGGMSLFKVDTPKNSTRFIQSGIKIDFSERRKSPTATGAKVSGLSKASSKSRHESSEKVGKRKKRHRHNPAETSDNKSKSSSKINPSSNNALVSGQSDDGFVVKCAGRSQDRKHNTPFVIYTDPMNNSSEAKNYNAEKLCLQTDKNSTDSSQNSIINGDFDDVNEYNKEGGPCNSPVLDNTHTSVKQEKLVNSKVVRNKNNNDINDNKASETCGLLLQERSTNVLAMSVVANVGKKASKKRKPSALLGNEPKVHVISNN